MDAFLEPLDDNDTVAEQIGEILRVAQNNSLKIGERLEALAKAEQFLLVKDQSGHLLDNFLDEMLEFMNSSNYRLKCFVANFIEKACKKDPEVMKKGVGSLSFLLTTGSSNAAFIRVMKRVITVCASLYPHVLKWSVSRRADHEVERCWESFCVLKGRIMQNIETDNEGVRTLTLKFLESVVLAQSLKTEESEGGRGDLMSLNEVSRDHRFISYRKMQAEASHNLQSLLDQMALSHISAQNLLTALNVVCSIARQRPEFAGKVLDALEVLHVNLPPTLGTSQVKSVRKELKMHLLRILRNASAFPFHSRIITLLTDLGATQGEMNRSMPPNIAELRRKAKRAAEASNEPVAKKSRQEASRLEDDEYAEETEKVEEQPVDSTKQSAIDITAEFIFDRLNPTVVTNMVFIALMTLPDEMPATFASSYTPIAAAGTESQRRHLSRMMATQATQQELGPGVEQMRKEKLQKFNERQSARREGAYIPPTPAVGMGRQPPEKKPFAVPKLPPPAPVVAPKVKLAFNLLTATQQMSKEETMDLFNMAFTRIMNAERRAVQGGAGQLHNVILVRLATRYHTEDTLFEQLMIDFVVEEHKMRTELALLWVAELYAQYQGFSFCYQLDRPDGRISTPERVARYDRIMCGLLSKLYEKGHHKEAVFHKILLDAPLVTSNALQWLKCACLDKVYGAFGMTTLRELILTRNRQRYELLHLLFELTFFDQPDTNLRQSCVETLKELCELSYLKNDVREQLIAQLQLCTQPTPPPYFVPSVDPTELAWDESIIRNALLLYLAVLPMDASLFLPLANTYSNASKDFKKVVLRSVDTAVRSIGIHNPEMLRLVEECPKGAETLLARVVHLLTERNPVTKDLVVRLKKLHDERNTDVRSLIPVLNGLDKEDIIKILPQFVLKVGNQKTVNSVFKKLLTGRNIDTGEPVISGVELMLEYHHILPSTSDEADTQAENLPQLLESLSKETVASSVECLLDVRPLPPLFYSTLVQVYKKCPSLDGFLSNVVQKLIAKELWKGEENTKRDFFRSLTQLRTVAYTSILTCFTSDEFKEYIAYHVERGSRDEVIRALRDYLPSLSTHQQKSISSTIMDIVKERRERNREERDKDSEKDRAREERREKEREREREKEKGRRDRDRRESRRSID